MTRRTGVMVLFAMIGQIFRLDEAQAQQLTLGSPARLNLLSTTLKIYLGDGGYKIFEITDGTRTVTLTAAEIMEALVAGQGAL